MKMHICDVLIYNFCACFVLDAKILQLNNDTKLVMSAKEPLAKNYTFRNDLNVDHSIVNNNSIKPRKRNNLIRTYILQ